MTRGPIVVRDQGTVVRFGVQDLMRYHGPLFPGGVAHGFTAMERALPLLVADGIPERREIRVVTAFPGPGARDGIELVTRAVTEDRYVLDPALARPERGTTLERYVFRFALGERAVTVSIREGFVTDEFIALSRVRGRTATEEAHLAVLKQEMADRLLAVPADEVYDVDG
ncbi:hypothetical protein [Pseudonocardia sp.]|uniref:hypothetical protein n=1 Tax=Pseudonocardia sp. TaxID=60912 RepID=UPI0026095FF3|nr:hypothetical protein [Pseudonocardia sp.]